MESYLEAGTKCYRWNAVDLLLQDMGFQDILCHCVTQHYVHESRLLSGIYSFVDLVTGPDVK